MGGLWGSLGGVLVLFFSGELVFNLVFISMSTDPESRGGFGPYLEGVGPTFVDGEETKTIRFGVVEDLERALELYGKFVAAFLVEPIQGEAGYVACLLFMIIRLSGLGL